MIPSPRPSVSKLAPYVPGRPIEEVEAEYGIGGAVKLASNENPLGPSPRAVAAALTAVREVNRYPDGSGTVLRRALAARHGLSPDQVILGGGSSELIDIAVRTYLEPGDELLAPAAIFRMFPVAVGRAGGTIVEVPTLAGFRPDVDALLARVGSRTRILALANPNNPTGGYATRGDLERLLRALPDHVLPVVDEAYFEFARETGDYPDALDALRGGRPLLVLRTFSKLHGLAGLRIGYGFAPLEVVAAMNKVREPFNTTSVAQAAALAALDDAEHAERTRALVRTERAFLLAELARRPVTAHPSLGNFLLVDLPVPYAPVDPEFARRGVILRPMAGWGFPRSFRLSVGTRDENVRFLGALDDVIGAGLLRPEAPVPASAR